MHCECCSVACVMQRSILSECVWLCCGVHDDPQRRQPLGRRDWDEYAKQYVADVTVTKENTRLVCALFSFWVELNVICGSDSAYVGEFETVFCKCAADGNMDDNAAAANGKKFVGCKIQAAETASSVALSHRTYCAVGIWTRRVAARQNIVMMLRGHGE